MTYSFCKHFATLAASTGLLLLSACAVSELNDYSIKEDMSRVSPPHSNAGGQMKSAPSSESLSRDLFERVNIYRKSCGLRKLKWNDDMAKIADRHSSSMAANSKFSHKGFNGRVNALRGRGILTVSENLAYYRGGANSASVALQLWIESPDHYKNLSGKKYTMTGVGCGINSQGYIYFCQLYGK